MDRPSSSGHDEPRTPHRSQQPHARSISTSSSLTGSMASSRKPTEPGASQVPADCSSTALAAPHSPSASLKASLAHQSRRKSDALTNEVSSPPPLSPPAADADTPRVRPASTFDPAAATQLPDPAPSTTRPSFSETQSRRLSTNSTYSLASARSLVNSSSSSHAAPDSVASSRSIPPSMSSVKNSGPEPGLSNPAAPATPSAQQHHLSPIDPHAQPLDLMGRNQRTDSAMRSQPDRSRSRAKRRFSGSTAASSHSPSSDRGPNHRDKEECRPRLPVAPFHPRY